MHAPAARPSPSRSRPARVRSTPIAALLVATAALVGCESVALRDEGGGLSNTSKGGAVGALGGAAIGAIAGGRKGALIGLGIGALSGGAVGNYMDRQQNRLGRELANSGVTVVREGDNLRLNLPGGLSFASGSDTLQPRFDPVLADIAAVLAEYDKTLVDVVGHTDSTGSPDLNEALSKRRAQSVAAYMKRNGVIEARIVTTGKGQSEPVASNSTAAGRESNRRVEILLVPLVEA